MTQESYILKILRKFQMDECNSRAIPADPFTHLVITALPKNIQDENDAKFPYREAVGSLIFAVTCTRPDIAYAVNQVAQFSNKPSKAHWEAIKQILSYLKGTANHGICYGGTTGEFNLVAYSDADFAGNVSDRRSTSGVVLMLNGAPVS